MIYILCHVISSDRSHGDLIKRGATCKDKVQMDIVPLWWDSGISGKGITHLEDSVTHGNFPRLTENIVFSICHCGVLIRRCHWIGSCTKEPLAKEELCLQCSHCCCLGCGEKNRIQTNGRNSLILRMRERTTQSKERVLGRLSGENQ